MAPPRVVRFVSLAVLGLGVAGCGGKIPASPAVGVKPHSATLTWDASTSPVSGYHVYRAANPNAPPGLLGVTPADTTRYVDTSVEAGHTYYYSVKAYDSADRESEPSDVVSATIPAE